MLTRNLRFLATLLFVCTALPLNTADSSCTTESLPSFMNLDTCFVIPEDLCTNPDMLMPFTESLISCGLAAIADLELPSKLYLVEGIVVNLLKNFGLGKITSAAFGVCKAMGGILDTLDNLSLGILGNVIEPVKKLMSLLPLPDCSANSIKGTVKCGSRISVKLPSSLNAKECFKHVRTTCSLTKANKGPALVDLFRDHRLPEWKGVRCNNTRGSHWSCMQRTDRLGQERQGHRSEQLAAFPATITRTWRRQF
nr:uncharacterized protein LOC119179728 isoform X1 [Rhipicephalus microplus]